MIGNASKELQAMDSRMTRFSTANWLALLVGALAALLCWLVPARTASAAEASPAWRVSVLATKNFKSGAPFGADDQPPSYYATFKNIGSAPTTGLYKLTVTLPPGMSLANNNNQAPRYYPKLTCNESKSSNVTITCTGEEILYPGGLAIISLPIAVSTSTASPALASFEVEGGGVGSAAVTVSRVIDGPEAGFEFLPLPEGVSSVISDSNGQEVSQAGAHPTQDTVSVNFAWPNPPEAELIRLPDGGLNRLEVNLPKGFAVNPNATPVKCTEAQLEEAEKAQTGGGCPPSSQVGMITIVTSQYGPPTNFISPLYNMEAPHGMPAKLGFEAAFEIFPHLLGKVRSEDDYGLSALVRVIPAKIGVLAFETELWGVPTAEVHDGNRFNYKTCQGAFGCNTHLKSEERTEVPFLTAPTSCGHPLVSSATAVSYSNTNGPVEGSSLTQPLSGCNRLEFDPSISSQPTTPLADSPTGLNFNLHMPQAGAAESPGDEPPLSTANLKNAKVTLPAGMTLNPSAANGLGACSAEQIGLKTPVGQAQPVHFDEVTGGCPNDSKVGTVEVDTPLLEHPLTGSVYLAKPLDNPFGSLLAIYLAVEDEQTGIVAKLPGLVESDPLTGQLTTTFTESPELPIEDVKLSLFGGTKASLKTPLACGTKTTTSTLTPWTTPEGADASPTDQFRTSVEPRGGACPASEAAAVNAPSFSAGTVAPEAGAFSPFSLRLARQDGTQQITGIDTTLPQGLVGKLAGVPYCSEAAIALAKSRDGINQGALERANPSCPMASEVGTVEVGAGAGVTPYYTSGHVYLAGPYKGAPLSMVAIVPAVAGPFDLGTVVTRIALNVGEYSAQIHGVSDPLPTILHGVPLDVRSVELKLSRPGFTLNPTSCEQKAITGSVTSPTGSVAPLTNSFQVGGCKNLAFKPSLKLNLKGPTKRTGHPALKAVLTFPSKGTSANIASAQVGLPHGEFLDQSNIGTVCTQPQLKAQTCPPASIYGKAKAWTPLLDKPLEGPVYLGAGFGHKLPDLVADLDGQIRVLVHGKVDTTKQGGIRNTFEAVPDAPVSKFVLEMQGGNKKGLLVNSENVCRRKQKAEVNLTAQNGKVLTFKSPIHNSCKGGGGKKAKGKGGKKHGR
jgi:hypothetical protein